MMLDMNTKLENCRTEKGEKHFPFFLLDLKLKPKSSGANKGTKRLSFLDLPGEIRNQIYNEVVRSSESPGAFLKMSKVSKVSKISNVSKVFKVSKVDRKHAKVKHSMAWTFTQVSKQIRVELRPLLLKARTPRVALRDFAEYINVFHCNLSVEKTHSAVNVGQYNQGDIDAGPTQIPKVVAWISSSGVYGPLPSNGVDLLPILQALDKCPDVAPDFSSRRIFNRELAILDALYRTWKFWRGEVAKFGILEMNLTTMSILNKITDCSEYADGPLCATLMVRYKKSVHNTEEARILALANWVFMTKMRTMHERKLDLEIFFVRPKETYLQPGFKLSIARSGVKLSMAPSGVKLTIAPSGVKMVWFNGWKCRWATLRDDEDRIHDQWCKVGVNARLRALPRLLHV